jgi:hypothetical protein
VDLDQEGGSDSRELGPHPDSLTGSVHCAANSRLILLEPSPIAAACGRNVAGIFPQQCQLGCDSHEKGCKFHEMSYRHTLEGCLAD